MNRPTTYGLQVSLFTTIRLGDSYYSLLVLDPRVMYTGLLDKYKDEDNVLVDLASSKASFEAHFLKYYAQSENSAPVAPASTSIQRSASTLAFFGSFGTVRERQSLPLRELEQFFALQPEAIDACSPMTWWSDWQGQFPQLSRMARDIFSIPGQY